MADLPAISAKQIAAFRAVMEGGSITGAAELMYITQPAVSRLIRDLEYRIGFSLFERRKGRILPTVEAKALFEEVQRSFRGIENITAAAEEIRNFRTGYLQIAALPAIALRFLPRVVTAFTQDNPGINVSIQIRSSTKVMEWVGSQQIDVGFAALQSSHAGVEQRPLYSCPLVAVLPEKHRLAGEMTLTPDLLQDEQLIMLGSEHGIRQRIVEAFALRDVPLVSRIEAQLSLAVCEFVIAGAGIGLTDGLTAHEMTDRGIVIRPFEPAIPYFVSLMLPINRTRPVFFEAFMSMIVTELSKNSHLQLAGDLLQRQRR